MTPADVLVRVIERLDMTAEGAHVFTADEVQAWPSGAFHALADSDFLIPSAPASSVGCDGCEEACIMPVEVVRTDPGKPARAFIICDKPGDYGRIPVSIECLGRWRTDMSRWASFLAAQLQADQTPREAIPGALWELGKIATGAGDCNGYFAYGTALTDVAQVSAIAAVIRNSTAPLILAPSTPPARLPLPGAVVLSLRRVLCLREARVLVDRQAVETALARYLKTDSVQGNVFRRNGDYWTISYGEGPPFRLKDAKGLRYIAHLLSCPREEIHAGDLVALFKQPYSVAARHLGMTTRQAGEEGLSVSDMGNAGEIADDTMREQYGKRLRQLGEEREEASMRGDAERLEKIDKETESIDAALSQAFGLGGRPRKGSDPNEKARKAVLAAITRALESIRRNDNDLWRHLQNSLERGTFLCYRPEQPTQWSTLL